MKRYEIETCKVHIIKQIELYLLALKAEHPVAQSVAKLKEMLSTDFQNDNIAVSSLVLQALAEIIIEVWANREGAGHE